MLAAVGCNSKIIEKWVEKSDSKDAIKKLKTAS